MSSLAGLINYLGPLADEKEDERGGLGDWDEEVGLGGDLGVFIGRDFKLWLLLLLLLLLWLLLLLLLLLLL